MMREVVMLGSTPRTQRSHSSIQLPANFSAEVSTVTTFSYTTNDFVIDLQDCKNWCSEHCSHKLKNVLHTRWNAAKEKNVFNYGLNCMYKCLDGDYNLSMQLNIERGELRRKPMRFKHIREQFNHLRWNFTKLHENEILFYLRCEDDPISEDALDRHLIAVNASPLERDHSLIVPAVNKCLPQVLTPTAVRCAVDMMLLVDDDTFHVLFNSLLGQASVNHLHMHCLYWPYESDLIYRRFERLSDEIENVYIIRPPQWMCSTIAFQMKQKEDYDDFKKNITRCVEFLTDEEQAHNVFFTRAAAIRTDGPTWVKYSPTREPMFVTAYVFPRTNMVGAKPPTNFNPAANELAGCLTSYTLRFFESAHELGAVRIIEEEAQLTDKRFDKLCAGLADVLCERPIFKSKPSTNSLLADLTSPEIDELRDEFQTFETHSPTITRRPRAKSMGKTDKRFLFAIPDQ